MPSNSRKLVFDIETIGEDFEELDKTTQDALTRWIERESGDDTEYRLRLDDLKNGMGFSPLTGQIVAIGVLDVEKMKGGVYYQAPGQKSKRFDEDGVTYEAMTEVDMVRKFWDIAREYDVFVTFNGRQFDVPFLVTRSAINGVKPTKDLMRGRYLYQQHADAIHIDLQDQLSFYGAMRRKGSLHLWTRAFGIVSPKSGGVTGDDVTDLFKRKKYLDIARYNVRDIVATKELYEKWETYFNV
ncbi:MAG: ribonuclease H-like domain-containing protein [Patescibacteria group bacterium]